MKQKLNPLFALLIICSFFQIKAQSTFTGVYNILQSNCASSSCHGSVNSAAGLDFTASSTDVFNSLVNQAPSNSTANNKGNKLVKPGYTAQSFLFRKIASSFDQMISLDSSESAYLSEHQQLSNEDLELVRQWIQFGASETDTVIDVQIISDFYNGSGLPLINKPASPADQGLEGIQLRIGPIMLLPGQEEEFFHKFEAGLSSEKEIYRMEAVFDVQSHHFVIYDFDPASAATYPEGPQNAGSYLAQIAIHFGASELNAWNVSRDDMLPPGTAYFWDQTTQVVLDYHVRNYNSSLILGAISYLNLYTRDRQPGTREMKMEFPVYGGLNPFILKIPPTGQPFKREFSLTQPGETWDIWKTQGHTHLLGTDFDVYLRNADGTRGAQIYEGFYNSSYTFNQGYFDNQHAPVRTTENPFVEVDMNKGVILEATWVNNGPDTASFGLTTKNEMFAAYISYTIAETPSGIFNSGAIDRSNGISVYPNPSSAEIKIALDKSIGEIKTLKIFSVQGKLVYENIHLTGNEIILPAGTLHPGIYMVEINSNENQRTKLLIF